MLSTAFPNSGTHVAVYLDAHRDSFMADNDTLLLEPRSPAQIGKIDLARYRTGDLAERLAEWISVPGALRKILTTAFILAVVPTRMPP